MLVYALEYVAMSYVVMAVIVRSLCSVRLPNSVQDREANQTLWALFVISPIGVWICFLIWIFALTAFLLQPVRDWMLHEGRHSE